MKACDEKQFTQTGAIAVKTLHQIHHITDAGLHCLCWYNPGQLSRYQMDQIIGEIFRSGWLDESIAYKPVFVDPEFCRGERYFVKGVCDAPSFARVFCETKPEPIKPLDEVPIIVIWCNSSWTRIRTALKGLVGYNKILVIASIDRTEGIPPDLPNNVEYHRMVNSPHKMFKAKECPKCLEFDLQLPLDPAWIPPRLRTQVLEKRDFHFPPLSPSPA